MAYKHFTNAFPTPKNLFFDLDKKKFQIANDAESDEISLTRLRKECQSYNTAWNAYLHGLRAAN